MKIKSKQYAQSLYELVENKEKEEAEMIIKDFAKMMIRNNHKSKLEKTLRYFSLIWNRSKGVLDVEIISVGKLDDETEKSIMEYVWMKAKDREVTVKKSINKKIIGGFIVRLNGTIFDLSLKSRVDEMRKIIC